MTDDLRLSCMAACGEVRLSWVGNRTSAGPRSISQHVLKGQGLRLSQAQPKGRAEDVG